MRVQEEEEGRKSGLKYQYARVSIRQHIRGLRGKGVPTDSRHSNWHNCVALLADRFLYSYKAEFIPSLLSAVKKQFAFQFNFTYRNLDNVLSINNADFQNHHGQMYPFELEIKDATESNTSASY